MKTLEESIEEYIERQEPPPFVGKAFRAGFQAAIALAEEWCEKNASMPSEANDLLKALKEYVG